MGRGGRRYSLARRVLGKLLWQLKQDNPSLSVPQKVKLCEALFDRVLLQHGRDLPGWNELIGEVEAVAAPDACNG